MDPGFFFFYPPHAERGEVARSAGGGRPSFVLAAYKKDTFAS